MSREWAAHTAEHAAKISAAKRGKPSPCRKLSAESVAIIRASKGLVSQRELARTFGVGVATIHSVQSGHRYRDVSPHCLAVEEQTSMFGAAQ